MAKPASREELVEYCKRQLGAPVLEINVSDEQIDDLVDDAFQYFQERHFDGIERMYLKYQFTQGDIDRGKAQGTTGVGIVTTTGVSTAISGYGTTTSNFYETSNFIQVPETVVGIEKIFKFDMSAISGFNSVELLQYAMVKSYLEDIDFLLTTEAQIRFNKRQDRLYLDIDYNSLNAGDFIVIDCHRILDPTTYTQLFNDSFLKRYLTSLIKRQWGQNLIKFKGVKLPGGIELNGREIYDDALRELQMIKEEMSSTYELPPLDFIG